MLTHCSRTRRGGEAGVLISNRGHQKRLSHSWALQEKKAIPGQMRKGAGAISGSGRNINKAQRCETACYVWGTINSYIQGSNTVRFTFLQESLAAVLLKV